jgi:hypothetical protein
LLVSTAFARHPGRPPRLCSVVVLDTPPVVAVYLDRPSSCVRRDVYAELYTIAARRVDNTAAPGRYGTH